MAADTSYRVKYDKYILYLILNTWSYVGHEKASELDVLLSRSAPPAMIFEFASGGRYWHHASPAAISTSCLQVRVAEVASLPSPSQKPVACAMRHFFFSTAGDSSVKHALL